MSGFDIQQVCLNGHQITAWYKKYPQYRKKYCTLCGSETIYQCQHCNADIIGNYDYGNLLGPLANVPEYCNSCGAAYPWTEKRINKIRSGFDYAMQKIIKDKDKPRTDLIMLIEQICLRFHLFVTQLMSRYNSRQTIIVNDEYDVQDLLHALLRLFFNDIRPEEWTPSYAGKCSRVDFLLKNEQIIIEVKKTRNGLGSKEIGEQLIIDKERYKMHPDCKILFCFVYDPDGIVVNPQGLENDLNCKEDDFKVFTYIVPKGY